MFSLLLFIPLNENFINKYNNIYNFQRCKTIITISMSIYPVKKIQNDKNL